MRLVTSGLYAWVRHPLYVSVVTASVGWALIWASVWALGLAVVLGFYLNAKAAREEQWLRAVYPEYGSYAQRVKRWLPGVY
jgi:protein-S-isoprenylcysteine O-methyltransferase Ste14